jgi:serine-type D-Ala-D-Ala carboxypeptidase (penicillin-binding protein 5/6)
MRPRILVLLAALAALLAVAGVDAAAGPPPPVDADAVLVADGRTGEVLYALNEDERMPMASITKLMTALVTLENARPRDVVTVSPQAVGRGGSTIFLTPGEQLRVRDLLAAALVQSANDAAFALAAHVGDGSVQRFVGLMNAEAAELGLEDTRYARPDGLDTPRHYSTAEDTLRLARLAMRQPLVRKLVRTRTMRVGNRTFRNWNDLLWTFDGLFGVKTGHTDDAGWTEVAAARRGGTSLYAVVLGSPTRAGRNADLTELLEWGFDQYARFTLVREGERYGTASIPFSDDERLELVSADGASQVVRLGSGTQFVERVVAPAMVDLPVRRGQKLGEVVVMDGEREVARVDLVAVRDVEAPGFRDRAVWYADRALDEAGSMVSAVLPGI